MLIGLITKCTSVYITTRSKSKLFIQTLSSASNKCDTQYLYKFLYNGKETEQEISENEHLLN